MRIASAAAAAAAFALLAGPAAAVTVTQTSARGGNSVTVVTAEPGRLEADFAIRNSSPIRLWLQPREGEADFAFNSVVEIFTALESGENIQSISLVLKGATFDTIGDIAPAFVNHTSTLNQTGTLMQIAFARPGEPFGVQLGAVGGGSQDFGISFDGSGPASLTLQASVPEPAGWALMILGFLAVGGSMRAARPAPSRQA